MDETRKGLTIVEPLYRVVIIDLAGERRPLLLLRSAETADKLAYAVLVEFNWSCTHREDKRIRDCIAEKVR